MQFKIVPKKNIEFFVEGNDPGDALINFATLMDTDMNLYFEAVPVEPEKTAPWAIVKRVVADENYPTFELGEISIGKACVTITDPCYNRDVWCRMNDVSVVPGDYTCAAYFSDEGEWGVRVSKIGIYRGSDVREAMEFDGDCEYIGEIGVDAGLAGIFEKKPDFTDEQWSKFCSDIHVGDAWIAHGSEMNGFFSSSGYGDGSYGVYGHRRPGASAYDGIEIVFIDSGADDEDESVEEEE